VKPLARMAGWLANEGARFEAFMRAFNVQGSLPNSFERQANLSVQIADLDALEMLWLRRTTSYNGGGNIGAGAGITNITLANPVGSGVLAVVKNVVLVNAGALGFLCWRMDSLAVVGGNLLCEVPADSRIPVDPASLQALPVCKMFATTAGSAFTSRVLVPANQPFYLPLTFVLSPGHRLVVGQVTAAQGLNVIFNWTEQRIGPQEP